MAFSAGNSLDMETVGHMLENGIVLLRQNVADVALVRVCLLVVASVGFVATATRQFNQRQTVEVLVAVTVATVSLVVNVLDLLVVGYRLTYYGDFEGDVDNVNHVIPVFRVELRRLRCKRRCSLLR